MTAKTDLPPVGMAPAVPTGASGIVTDTARSADEITLVVEFSFDGVTCLRSTAATQLQPRQQAIDTSAPRAAPHPPGGPAARAPRVVGPVTATGRQARATPSLAEGSDSAAGAAGDFKGWAFLVPTLLYRCFFSLRRPVLIQTTLTADRIHQLFRETLGGIGASNKLLAITSSYTRNVRWNVRGTGTESFATCRPEALVTWGAGRFKRQLDVTGDEIAVVTTPQPGSRTVASLELTKFTTVLGMFAFPGMILYSNAVLKSWRREDPALLVRYPWSRSRIAVWALLISFVISVAS